MGGGGTAWLRRAVRAAAKSGPLPWAIIAILVVAGVAASGLVVPSEAPAQLPPASYDEVVARLAAGNVSLVQDVDRDGLPDALETHLYGSDPRDWDTSGDGLPDGWIVRWGADPTRGHASRTWGTPPANALPEAYHGRWPAQFQLTWSDAYAFQRPANWSETEDGPWDNGLDPRQWDVNQDGLPDAWVLHYELNPLADVRGLRPAGDDGLTVAEAFEHNTDPRRIDTDGDGLRDMDELAGVKGEHRFPPSDPARYSSAGLGVCDGYLVAAGLDPQHLPSLRGDSDRDGATTIEEFEWSLARHGDAACAEGRGLDPMAPSTGGSGLPDGWLMRHGLDPTDPGIGTEVTDKASAAGNLSEVALSVRDEYEYGMPPQWGPEDGVWWNGTSPTLEDSDADGLSDAQEIQGWYVTASTAVGSPSNETRHVTPDPRVADTDGDGMPDALESEHATDPRKRDTDFDGLPDVSEAGLGLDPLQADSIRDHLLDGQRVDALEDAVDRIARGAAYPYPGAPGQARLYEEIILAQPAVDPESPAAEVASVHGDLDGDGVANVVDPDIDGDGLLNGWEHEPRYYAKSPHGTGPLPDGRSATHALNQDTDGDGLRDGWEVTWGQPRFDLGRMDPDPARYDTDGDGISDGHEDPDHDSITWYNFVGGQRQQRSYNHTNLAEQSTGTDPHSFATDGDGLADGWKVHWGSLYAGPIDLNTPPPVLGRNDADTVVMSIQTVRNTQFPEQRLAHESPASAPTKVIDGDETRFVTQVAGVYDFTLLDAQAAKTNPFLLDADGDGVPDAWEYYQAERRVRIDAESASCQSEVPPSPLRIDGLEDHDGDGLSLVAEWQARTDPMCPDTDLGGIEDGQERQIGNLDPTDATDDRSLLDQGIDRDHDGVPDFEEFTGTPPTDPSNPDTDGDGLLDGDDVGSPGDPVPTSSDIAASFLDMGIVFARVDGGFVFIGESGLSDPLIPDSTGSGIPDGWLAAHGRSPSQAPPGSWETCYRYAMPAWWDEGRHGPWWGGGDPLLEDCSTLASVRDADHDGLDDVNGEDPFPAANHANTFPRGDPQDSDGLDERLRAQAVVQPRSVLDHRLARGATPAQAPPVTATRLHDVAVENDRVAIGGQTNVTGQLRLTDGPPAAGVVIVAELAGHTMGATASNATGHFRLPMALQRTHAATIDADSVLLGSHGPRVEWDIDIEALRLGDHQLVIRSYATPDQGSVLNRSTVGVPIQIEAQLQPAIDAPDRVVVGRDMQATIQVQDGAGTARRAEVQIQWQGESIGPLETNDQGTLVLTLPTEGITPGSHRLDVATVNEPPYTKGQSRQVDIDIVALSRLAIDLPATVDAGTNMPVRGSLTADSVDLAGIPVQIVLGDGSEATTLPTDADGEFHGVVAIPATMQGPRIIRATIEPHTDRTAASTSEQIDIRGQPVLVDTSRVTTNSSGPHTITGRLTSMAGDAIPDAELTAEIGPYAVTVQTLQDGRFAVEINATFMPGPIQQRLAFPGDPSHAPAFTNLERHVRSNTHLVVPPGTAAPGTMANTTIRLLDEAGAGIGMQPVTIWWDDEVLASHLTDAEGHLAIDWLIPPDARLGTHYLKATFDGTADGAYAGTTSASTWHVQRTREVQVEATPYLRALDLPHATLVDGQGQAIPGVPVQVTSAVTGRFNTTTDEHGRFAVAASPMDIRWPGHHQFTFDAPATDTHAALQETKTLRVVEPTRIALHATPLVADQLATLRVQVLTESEHTARSGSIVAHLGNSELQAVELEGDHASIRFTVPRNATLGPNQIHVQYAGSERMAAAHASIPVTIRAPTQLRAYGPGSDPGGPVRFELTAGDEPIPRANFTVRIAGIPNGFNLTTDSRGQAVLPIVIPSSGVVLTASYAGNTAHTSNVTALSLMPEAVQPPSRPTWPWVVAIVTAGLCIAVGTYLWWRRRQHPLISGLRRARRMIRADGPYEADILQAYATLEDHLIDAGFLSDEANTPRLLAEAIRKRIKLGRVGKDLDHLIDLFEQARYGDEPMQSLHRDTARSALGRLRTALIRQGIAWEALPP